ncbi:MAG: hypothetical protein ACRBF0_20675 [Calditrichia bacterium]
MKNIIFIGIDFAVFFMLWMGPGIHWGISFFLSTAITFIGWWAFEWLIWLEKFRRNGLG